MGRQYGRFEWDDSVGTPGHRSDGSYHQNLYDEDGKLKGHARFIPEDEPLTEEDDESYSNTFVTSESRREDDGSDALVALIGIAFGAALGIAGVKAAPYVKRWWHESGSAKVQKRVPWIHQGSQHDQPTI